MSNTNSINVQIHNETFKLNEFLDSPKSNNEWSKPGVYVWFWGNIIWYVGKSESNVWNRNQIHAILQSSGAYSLPNKWTPEELLTTNPSGKQVGWNQKGYSSHLKTKPYKNSDLLASLTKNGIQFTNEITVYLVYLNNNQLNVKDKKIIIKKLEAELIKKLNPFDNRSKPKTDDTIRFSIDFSNTQMFFNESKKSKEQTKANVTTPQSSPDEKETTIREMVHDEENIPFDNE
jgi:hypothetical protein